jgi:hypothetical protein
VKRVPIYSFVGLAIMAASELLMFAHVEPFWSWHTPIVWTGYILFVDGLVWARRGTSWLTRSKGEFVFLAVMSIPLWLIFEAYNLLIQNWHYINLPASPLWRTFGYAWSFATIWPAIFETAELVATLRGHQFSDHHRAFAQPLSAFAWISIFAGVTMLLWPIVWPSPYLAAPIWLGFIFLLDPLNCRAGAEAICGDWDSGRERLVNLSISGFVCGVAWEFWNYWAHAKWIYTVPIFPTFKIFEMPLPGYLGFPAFAVECFAMYVAARHWLWRGWVRRIGL